MSAILPSQIDALPTRHLGRRVLVFPTLDSTNSYALSLADDPANDGVAVLARAQSAGRGQHGRTWQAPAGSSVLLSVLLFPPSPVGHPALLTAWAAVSVVELIADLTQAQATIKWPNDVYLDAKKVCGILIEQRSRGREAPATVVGIGLNVRQRAEFFDQAQLPLGGSLLTQTARELETDDVARRLLLRLDEEYGRLVVGDIGTLETRWRERLGVLDQRVEVHTASGVHEGWLAGLSFDGILLARDKGDVQRFAPEAVRQVRPV